MPSSPSAPKFPKMLHPDVLVLWDEIGDFVCDTVDLFGTPSQGSMVRARWAVARMTVWAYRHGMDLDRDVVFTEDNVDAFASDRGRYGIATLPSVSSVRSLLRRVARDVTGSTVWADPDPKPRRAMAEPYPPGHVHLMRRSSLMEPDADVSASAQACLALARGAGLRPGEVFAARAAHVVTSPGGRVAVYVPGQSGRADRTLVVDADWAGMVAAVRDRSLAADPTGMGRLVGPGITTSNGLRDRLGRLSLPGRLKMDGGRLRTTWFFARIAHMGLSDVLDAAGLVTAENLRDLVPDEAVSRLADPEMVERLLEGTVETAPADPDPATPGLSDEDPA